MVDWTAIKTEYITTDTSYRKLGEKHGVTYSVIGEKARLEGWVEQREQFRNKNLTDTIDAIGEARVDRAAKLLDASDRLMEKVVEYMDRMKFTGFRDTQSMKHLSGVLKDLKEIQMIRSDADLREQEARIASLQRQANKDASSKDVTVEMSEEVEALSG